MPKQPQEKSGLDKAIDECLACLASYPEYSDEYARAVKQLVKLYKLKETKTPGSVDPNVLLTVGGNLVIALVLIAFEQNHVITTRIHSFLTKVR